jgi:hypothetical protein
MKIVCSSLVSTLALIVGLALLAPVPTHAQRNGNLQITQVYFGAAVPAAGDQYLRVTIGNASGAAPTDTSDDDIAIIVAAPGSPGGHVKQTLDPGASLTYTLDPREVGQLVDPRRGLYHVPVRFGIEAEAVEGRPAPQPSVTIEVVETRTGEVASFLAFPGFSGGVYVAAGDVN